MASKSSTRSNGPLFSRNCTIAFAVLGPIPGSCWSCSSVAVFTSIGFAGGFFCALAKETSSTHAARSPQRSVSVTALRLVSITRIRLGEGCVSLSQFPDQPDVAEQKYTKAQTNARKDFRSQYGRSRDGNDSASESASEQGTRMRPVGNPKARALKTGAGYHRKFSHNPPVHFITFPCASYSVTSPKRAAL